jgi:Bacterial cellulose synthase subunit
MNLIETLILLLIRAAFIVAGCTLANAAWAQAIDRPLAQQDVQIKGASAQATFKITVDAKKDRQTEPVLHLEWRKSRLVDPKRSTLSIVINGTARRTLRLTDLGDGHYQVPLTDIAGGEHSMVLRANLRVDDDPCLQQHRDDAWFTIKSDTAVKWMRRDTPASEVSSMPVHPINRYPGAWRRMGDGWSGVHLNMLGVNSADTALEPEQAAAYLEAHHLLLSWAFRAQQQATPRTVGSLRLLTLFDLNTKTYHDLKISEKDRKMLIAHFESAPSVNYIITSNIEGVLSVIGRNDEGLRSGISLLANDTGRMLCSENICDGTSTANTPLAAAPKLPLTNQSKTQSFIQGDTSNPEATKVWSMQQADYSKGWSARGEGTHKLTFTWQRPPTWKIAAWPILYLSGQTSNASTLDAVNSVVTVRLNGRPLASYPLSQWQTQHSEIRIPEELWQETQWFFEIVVTLKALHSKSCVGADEDSVWFTLGADTQLHVPRQIQTYDSVGQFYVETVAQGKLPLLHGVNIKIDALESLAVILYPFYQSQLQQQLQQQSQNQTMRHNNEKNLRWKWVDSQTCRLQHCVQLLSQSNEGALLRIVGKNWQANGMNLPNIPTAGTAAMFYQAKNSRDNAQDSAKLYVVPGQPVQPNDTQQLDLLIEPPDYTALLGRIALFSKQWIPLDVQAITADGVLIGKSNLKENPLDKNTPSKEQNGLRWLNFVWAGISLLILSGVLLKLWRKPKNKTVNDHWELHD